MATWVLKSALQNLIGRLPQAHRWNSLFQKWVTKGYYPSREAFEDKLRSCSLHFEHYTKFSSTPQDNFRALELGTGPWPIVPIGLYLCGAAEVRTYDIVPVLNNETLRNILQLYSEVMEDGTLERIVPHTIPGRMARLAAIIDSFDNEPPTQALEKLNIHLLLGDARKTMLPDRSIDLFFSTVVLEHINHDILMGLLKEFRRVAAADAIMSHYVGLADQYANFDKSITPYNFLQYSDQQWRLFNNPVIPQSRLRLADYREVLRRTGWTILKEQNSSGALEDLNKIRLASEFTKYSTEDLLVLYTWLVAKPAE